jgi:serine/threonine protein kinase
MKGPLPPDKEKSEIRNPESEKAANSDFELRASKFGTEPSPQLLQILEVYLDELEHGAQPNPQELLARHPELADELQGCLASLEFLHVKSEISKTKSQDHPIIKSQEPNSKLSDLEIGSWNLGFPPLGQLGDFRLLREVGRGGMGVVYEAEQISLRRRVALKVLPFAAALDAKQLQRFKNEALAAAGLQHPHIVPIHAVGSDRGVHYYAMQFIDGKSLADVIAQLRKEREAQREIPNPKSEKNEPQMKHGFNTDSVPCSIRVPSVAPSSQLESTVEDRVASDETPVDARRSSIIDSQSSVFHPRSSILNPRSSFFRTVAQLGIQAAEALEHAHRLGIVHRDIKPANLILDNEGKLWVTDFGLAMVQNNAELTVTGDLVGTLRYMSPEQATAQRGLLDQRTDIYSLGATLYELLTLRPVFAESDRHQLLAQIATVDPRRPRRHNPAIPQDLETIIQKALGKSPQERYATAEQMAEDLKRFLADQPIRARRPSVSDRAVKWCRRHKALVAGSIFLIVGTSILCAAFFYDRQMRTKEAYQAKLQEEQRLMKQHQRLIDNLILAYQAMDELGLKPALDRMARNKDPQKQQEDQELLRKYIAYYQRFAHMNISEPRARRVAALACHKVGDCFDSLGEKDKGKEAYDKGIDMLQELVAEYPKEPQYRHDFIQIQDALGRLFWTNSDPGQTEQILVQETKDLEQAVEDFPTDPGFRHELANCRQNLSMALLVTGHSQKAEEILEQTQPILEKLTADSPDRPDFQQTLAGNHKRLAEVFFETGRDKEAERAYSQARDILERLPDCYKQNPDCQSALANAYLNLGTLARESARLPDSEKAYRRSLELSENLVKAQPLIPDHEKDVAVAQYHLGMTLAALGRSKDAQQAYREAAKLLERLMKDFPAKHAYQKELACCLSNLGALQEQASQPVQAEEAYVRAATLLEALTRSFPAVLEYQSDAGVALCNQARLLAQRGEKQQARQLVRQAIELQEKAVKNNPRHLKYQAFLKEHKELLAKLKDGQGKADEAKSSRQ